MDELTLDRHVDVCMHYWIIMQGVLALAAGKTQKVSCNV